MRVHSYTIVHYGADYVCYALRSVYDQVEKLHVFYTPHPSHSHRVDVPPPESRDEIATAALACDPEGKIIWHETDIWQEGPQRDYAVDVCRQAGAEMVLVVDYDEVWHDATLEKALRHAWESNSVHNWLLNFTTLWRSFGWVCHDELWPVRIKDLRHVEGTAYLPRELGETYHFGYAVRDEIMRYKWLVHGHKNEALPGWWRDKWEAWPPPENCHPTCEHFWNPEPFDRAELPALLREHPFYNLERIE